MAQKPMDKITIHDITELCGIRRQNFYYHFEDVYDLMRWMFSEEAVSLLLRHEGTLLWQEGLLQLFQYLDENRAVCLCALNSVGRDCLKRFFESDIYSIIYRTIERIGSELGALKVCPDADIDMMTHFYVVATAGLMESWLVGEIDKTPEEIIRIHSQSDYYVYMLGFAPGHPYGARMENPFSFKRRQTPRVKIPAGSIVVQLGLSDIIPFDQPCGWNIIGTTPVPAYDPRKENPFLLQAGQWMRHIPISKEEFAEIRSQVEAGTYVPKTYRKEKTPCK